MNTPVHDPEDVLAFLRGFTMEHGHSPSYRQIMDACGMKSTSHVSYHLKKLEEQGRIRRNKGEARTVVVL